MYRAMTFNAAEAPDRYALRAHPMSSEVQWPSFNFGAISLQDLREVAQPESVVVFRIELADGCDASPFAADSQSSQREVLIPPWLRFVVTSTPYAAQGFVVIDLRQMVDVSSSQAEKFGVAADSPRREQRSFRDDGCDGLGKDAVVSRPGRETQVNRRNSARGLLASIEQVQSGEASASGSAIKATAAHQRELQARPHGAFGGGCSAAQGPGLARVGCTASSSSHAELGRRLGAGLAPEAELVAPRPVRVPEDELSASQYQMHGYMATDVEKLFRKWDEDGDGKLSLREFARGIEQEATSPEFTVTSPQMFVAGSLQAIEADRAQRQGTRPCR